MTGNLGQRRWAWLHILAAGLIVWLFGVGAVIYTDDPVLVPGVFLIGSFLVPFSLLFWVYEQIGWGAEAAIPTALNPYRVLLAFVTGGALGVTCSALLEDLLMRYLEAVYYLVVGVVEESVKLALVWLLARHLARYARRDGMLLGATVGLGFSAFESAGYAFNAAAGAHGDTLVHVMQTQAIRGLLTPLGHALWTGLVAGALFAASRNGRLRLDWNVLGWLALVIALHVAWDASGGVAAVLAIGSTGGQVTHTEYLVGQLTNPEGGQTLVYTATLTTLQTIDAVIGILLGWRMWRMANAELADAQREAVLGPTPQAG